MDHTTQIDLLDELLSLKADKSFFLDEKPTQSPVARYVSQSQFDQELSAVFSRLPQMAAHASELPQGGSFLKCSVGRLPVLLTRDEDGEVRAFLNVCRHRGTQLVAEDTGCAKRFSCPYHAWTWNNRGELLAVPHQAQGFPDLEKSKLGLKQLPCQERYGWIWVLPDTEGSLDLDDYLGALGSDLSWLQADDLEVFAVDEQDLSVNWKILIEGGIESYHFKVAHKDTIGPHFQDNLSSYQSIGAHLRSVLPRTSLNGLVDLPKEQWNIRKHTNIIYSIFPTSQLLVQDDHIVWINVNPLGPDQTRLRLHTLAPKPTEDKPVHHWQKNHTITRTTLFEDFQIGESIQIGLASGANEYLTFGRYEGALHKFNQTIDHYVETKGDR